MDHFLGFRIILLFDMFILILSPCLYSFYSFHCQTYIVHMIATIIAYNLSSKIYNSNMEEIY